MMKTEILKPVVIMRCEELKEFHYQKVREIYEEGIATGHATFEKSVPEWVNWDQNHLPYGRIIAIIENKVVGWAALSPVSERCVYAGIAEVSIYITTKHRGKGIGDELLKALINESEKNNIWTLQAGIFPENIPSIKIHEQNGFRKVGIREKLGKMDDTWLDVLLFERRSKLVGIN